jgi:RNA polymerase sigma factor (sigma-70 family)
VDRADRDIIGHAGSTEVQTKPAGGLVRLSGVGKGADPELAAFCRLEWPRLVGSVTLYTGERDLAEELAQETLIRACQHWGELRQARSRSAWTHRVAFNLAKSRFRRRAVQRRHRHHESMALVTRDPDSALSIAVRDAVAALPETQRRALVLRYFADLSVRDVAALMDCPENTVKTHTSRALAALRDAGLGVDPEVEPRPLAAGGTA